MAKVKAEYKLDGKWRSKMVEVKIPTDEYGFTLTKDLCKVVSLKLEEIISPNIILRKVQVITA